MNHYVWGDEAGNLGVVAGRDATTVAHSLKRQNRILLSECGSRTDADAALERFGLMPSYRKLMVASALAPRHLIDHA